MRSVRISVQSRTHESGSVSRARRTGARARSPRRRRLDNRRGGDVSALEPRALLRLDSPSRRSGPSTRFSETLENPSRAHGGRHHDASRRHPPRLSVLRRGALLPSRPMGPPLARLPSPRRLLDPLSLHRRHPRSPRRSHRRFLHRRSRRLLRQHVSEIPPPRRAPRRRVRRSGPRPHVSRPRVERFTPSPLRRRALRVRSTPRGGENAESSLTDPFGPTRVGSLEVIVVSNRPLTTTSLRRSVAPRATRRRANLGRTDGRRANENPRACGSRRRRRARVDRAHAAVPSCGNARRPPRVVMSDDDDYGFTYSDEDECDEEEVDVENAYYNAKGARAGGIDRGRARQGTRGRDVPTRAFISFFRERERERERERGKSEPTDALERSPRAQVCSRMGRAKTRWRRSRRSSPWSARRVSGGSRR